MVSARHGNTENGCLGPALVGLLIVLSAVCPATAADLDNKLPDAVVAAFQNPDQVTLYAIEPDLEPTTDSDFHHYKVLGKSIIDRKDSRLALSDVQSSLANWNQRIGMCFNPHHGLRVRSGKHTYDLVICYLCQGLLVYVDDSTLLAALHITGTPALLNELSARHALPKPQILVRDEQAAKEQQRADAHWMSVMPASIKPVWSEFLSSPGPAALQPLREALAKEIPDTTQQILVLFAWYGSGAGPWSGFPAYEEVVAELLQRYPRSALLEVAHSDRLTDPQLRGAARFFAAPFLGSQGSDDRVILSQGLNTYFKVTANWRAAMPASIRPLWTDDMWYLAHAGNADLHRMIDALAQEFPDKNGLLLELLSWYGSGIGARCSFCARYEFIVDDLLFQFSSDEIVKAALSKPLTEEQLDGAARFFADWYFQRERPTDIQNFPSSLKSTLLAHIQKRSNEDWIKYSAAFK
jgi:hypothetical protein